jgi:hypothetical protein
MGFCYILDVCLIICRELFFNYKIKSSLIRFNPN